MLKVSRITVPKPGFLRSKLVADRERELAQHFMMERGERLSRRAPFDVSIVEHVEVVGQLDKLFGAKCAYCEQQLQSSRRSFVSHYRPLSNAASHANSKDSPDHYAWFAYTWRNLLLVCERCQQYKLHYFPITGETRAPPMSTWSQAASIESPLLLNPCVDDPVEHMGFDRWGAAYARTERGVVTIGMLNLNRQELLLARAEAIGAFVDLLANPAPSRAPPRLANLSQSSPHHGAVFSFARDLSIAAIDNKAQRFFLLRKR